MKSLQLFILILIFPSYCLSQYARIYDIPLPVEFSEYKESVTIYSSPNPDFPVYSDDEVLPIVWKHKTVIKADEDLKIIETGAYLMNKGEWTLRAAFKPKMTKKLFDTKSLKLSKGDSIVFQENWRYGNYTQTGWNFWYVKAINKKGEKIFGYEILETKGVFEDGLQVLPLMKDGNKIECIWTENDIDNTILIEIEKKKGSLTIKENQLLSFDATMDITSLLKEDVPLISHFFDLEKHPNIIFSTSSIEEKDSTSYSVKGDFCVNGECNETEWILSLNEDETSYHLSFELIFEMNKFSSVLDDITNYVSGDINIKIDLSYQKDYPGSMPWNDLGSYAE